MSFRWLKRKHLRLAVLSTLTFSLATLAFASQLNFDVECPDGSIFPVSIQCADGDNQCCDPSFWCNCSQWGCYSAGGVCGCHLCGE